MTTVFVAALIGTATVRAQYWANVTSLTTPRGALTATLLDKGKVLITGGTQPGVADSLDTCPHGFRQSVMTRPNIFDTFLFNHFKCGL